MCGRRMACPGSGKDMVHCLANGGVGDRRRGQEKLQSEFGRSFNRAACCSTSKKLFGLSKTALLTQGPRLHDVRFSISNHVRLMRCMVMSVISPSRDDHKLLGYNVKV